MATCALSANNPTSNLSECGLSPLVFPNYFSDIIVSLSLSVLFSLYCLYRRSPARRPRTSTKPASGSQQLFSSQSNGCHVAASIPVVTLHLHLHIPLSVWKVKRRGKTTVEQETWELNKLVKSEHHSVSYIQFTYLEKYKNTGECNFTCYFAWV
jgi:hypothetical protein